MKKVYVITVTPINYYENLWIGGAYTNLKRAEAFYKGVCEMEDNSGLYGNVVSLVEYIGTKDKTLKFHVVENLKEAEEEKC